MKEQHVHKYRKDRIGAMPIYRCMLPDCNHYLQVRMVIGKKTVCWRCNNEVIITPQMARQSKPHCRECNWEHVGVAGREAIEKNDKLPGFPAKGGYEI